MGPWLREMREKDKAKPEHVSLTEIALHLDKGVSTMSRIESGSYSVPADDLPKVLSAYRLTLEQFSERAEQAGKAAA